MFKKLLGTLLFAVAASFSATSWAQVIGYVHEVKGDVTLRDIGKQPAKAAAGDTFQQGAAVTTGADGQVTLKFEDGQLAILAPNSQFVATTYVFNKTRVADSNVLFSLARGGLRFVSGVIAATNSTKFAIRTPTATAGVRGTDGTVMFADGVTIATTGNGTLVLSVPPPPGSPPGTPPTVVSIPPGTTSIASGTGGPSAPAPTANVAVPAALTALATTIRAIAANPVATSNTPVNPTATGAAVRAAVALAVAVATGATPAQIANLQAAANTANQTATAANNVTATQAAAAGAIQAPPPATPVAPPPGTAPPADAPPPPAVVAPPPVTVVVPSGS